MQDLRPGEAQLVAILLAVFRDPDVLVLNRPLGLGRGSSAGFIISGFFNGASSDLQHSAIRLLQNLGQVPSYVVPRVVLSRSSTVSIHLVPVQQISQFRCLTPRSNSLVSKPYMQECPAEPQQRCW